MSKRSTISKLSASSSSPAAKSLNTPMHKPNRNIRSAIFTLLAIAFCMLLSGNSLSGVAFAADEVQDSVKKLVADLSSTRVAERIAAEKELMKLASANQGRDRERVFEAMPGIDFRMPADLRHRLGRIRQTLSKEIAEASVTVRLVTIDVKEKPLDEVFAELEKQTGNKVLPLQLGQAPDGSTPPMPKITLAMKDVPFWKVVDAVLDQAKLDVQSYSGEAALGLSPRFGEGPTRSQSASYPGPFRMEATEIYSQKNLKMPAQKSLRLTTEISWEPRLQPINLILPMDKVKAITDDGKVLNVLGEGVSLESLIEKGNQIVEIQLPFELPDRKVQTIKSIKGKFTALIPGKMETLKFQDLMKAKNVKIKRGGLTVTLKSVQKNEDAFDLLMQLRFEDPKEAIASHLDWAMQNVTYLEDDKDNRVEYSLQEGPHELENGFEVLYTFVPPEGKTDLSRLTWVYKTPAAIVEKEVAFEIKNIQLP